MIKKLAIANWKMNGDLNFVKDFFAELSSNYQPHDNTEVIFCPPHPLLMAMPQYLGSLYNVGAQDCHYQEKGAYTGDISPDLLQQLQVNYVIVGHSERRQYHFETDELVAAKAAAAIAHNLQPIICVGETDAQRSDGSYAKVIAEQISKSIPQNIASEKLIIAYEPVWAIGTGKVPVNQDILEVFAIIRETLFENFTESQINNIRILYGGSVNSKNCAILSEIPYLSGYLVGSASLKPKEFNDIINSLRD